MANASAIGWGLVILGSAVTVIGIKQAWKAWRMKHWEPTTGVITQCAFTEVSGSRQGEDRDRRYHLSLAYTYQVDSTPYEGTRLRYGMVGNVNSQKWVEQMRERYPQGSTVTVWVDPKDPAQCALERGPGWTWWVGPIVGVIFLISGLKLILM